MSSEFDLSTDLAAIQARLNGAFDGIHKILAPSQCAMPATDMEQQLKEQTQKMAEMAAMMKSMMSLAMPLLEEKASKLRKEKEAEARKKEERVREKQRELEKHRVIWKPAGEGAQCRHCKEYISPGSGYFIGTAAEIQCTRCNRSYDLLKQRPANELEKSGMDDFLRKHEYAKGTHVQYMWIWENTHFIRVLRQIVPSKQNKPDSNPTWICPNDGMVHDWTYNSKKYFRNYDGETWINKNDELGEWVGKWNPLTKTIDTTVPEPEFEDE